MYTKVKQAVLDTLSFDAGPHKYTMQGAIIPSVTQIIERSLPYDGLPSDVRLAALQRGDIVHKLTEVVDMTDNYLDYMADARAANLDGYVVAWMAFKQAKEPVILQAEGRVYHQKYRYAGTFDRVAYINGRVTLIEIKTGSLIPEYALQTAAYEAAYNDGLMGVDTKIQDRIVVLLRENGTYAVEQHKDKTDIGAFIAALTMANWRKAHGR